MKTYIYSHESPKYPATSSPRSATWICGISPGTILVGDSYRNNVSLYEYIGPELPEVPDAPEYSHRRFADMMDEQPTEDSLSMDFDRSQWTELPRAGYGPDPRPEEGWQKVPETWDYRTLEPYLQPGREIDRGMLAVAITLRK